MHPISKRRKLGQHNLVDLVSISKIVSAAKISKSESVLEVGAGRGGLTARLCEDSGRVISYELDTLLAMKARASLDKFTNLEVRTGDPFRSEAADFDVFVSNLPYSRSRDAIEWLARRTFKRAVVTVQQEFADKLCAKPGTKSFRAISAVAAFCFKIDWLFKIEPTSFSPPPKVSSTVLKLSQIDSLDSTTIKWVKFLFGFRNRLASAVARRMAVEFPTDKRIFELSPSELVQLARLILDVRSI